MACTGRRGDREQHVPFNGRALPLPRYYAASRQSSEQYFANSRNPRNAPLPPSLHRPTPNRNSQLASSYLEANAAAVPFNQFVQTHAPDEQTIQRNSRLYHASPHPAPPSCLDKHPEDANLNAQRFSVNLSGADIEDTMVAKSAKRHGVSFRSNSCTML